jgi:hypothetical protein
MKRSSSSVLPAHRLLEVRRRFVPPKLSIATVNREEPWRERPRLGAMNASHAPFRVAHATVLEVWPLSKLERLVPA